MLRKLLSSIAILATAAAFVAAFMDMRGGDLALASGTPSTPSPNALQQLFASNVGVGFERTVVVDLRDTGSAAGTYLLQATPSGSHALEEHLHLGVFALAADHRVLLYSGTLADFRRLVLGRLSPHAAARRFSFRLSLPSTGDPRADDRLQHLAARESFTWQVSAA